MQRAIEISLCKPVAFSNSQQETHPAMATKNDRLCEVDLDVDISLATTAYRRLPTRQVKGLLRGASSASNGGITMLEQKSSKYLSDDEIVVQDVAAAITSTQFRMSVRWALLLTAAVAVIGFVATTLALCSGDGLHLTSFGSNDKTESQRKELLDNYNSISGSLVALVQLPIQSAMSICAAVASLCFATE